MRKLKSKQNINSIIQSSSSQFVDSQFELSSSLDLDKLNAKKRFISSKKKRVQRQRNIPKRFEDIYIEACQQNKKIKKNKKQNQKKQTKNVIQESSSGSIYLPNQCSQQQEKLTFNSSFQSEKEWVFSSPTSDLSYEDIQINIGSFQDATSFTNAQAIEQQQKKKKNDKKNTIVIEDNDREKNSNLELKEYGNIEYDVAEKIVSHRVGENSQVYFQLKWKNQEKSPVYYNLNMVKKRYPELLLDYMLEKFTFKK